ncbi:unnamed protein product [Microthlaspi erraticum]|uniref:Uncharacterized protein n=1 Tax=Microthlaspi erraticum TaxID=1685480 RepID=A0A6D2ICE4_9BRAS|nr:unnamed protein product [Microthlaspi erraticum]
MTSRSSLRLAIEGVQPPEDQRKVLIDTFGHTWGWNIVPSEAALSVIDNYFDGRPVKIVGYEVLCTTHVRSQANQWANYTYKACVVFRGLMLTRLVVLVVRISITLRLMKLLVSIRVHISATRDASLDISL